MVAELAHAEPDGCGVARHCQPRWLPEARTYRRRARTTQSNHAGTPATAAPVSGAAGILDQTVGFAEQGIVHLDRLDRQVGRVGDGALHAVLAVLGGPPAEAAAERLEIDVAAAGARID